MKSLRSGDGGKIFKYQDFTEEETGLLGVSQTEAYIVFTDDDDCIAMQNAPDKIKGAPKSLPEQEEAKQAETAASFAKVVLEKARQEAEGITQGARKKAEGILAEAGQQAAAAAAAKEEGRKEGLSKGYEEGFGRGLSEGAEKGSKQARADIETKLREFFKAIDGACGSIDARKEEILLQNVEDLTELALAISEKIVCVSLESSGEVIKRMILSQAAPAAEKQWAKVIISARDAAVMDDSGIDIKSELCSISDKIELIISDDAAEGTCMVELPDHVVDASTGVQMQNIKDLIRGAGRD